MFLDQLAYRLPPVFSGLLLWPCDQYAYRENDFQLSANSKPMKFSMNT